jgi:hypothetical protein
VRILHRAPATADSAFAARGNALVRWDTTALQAPAPTALVVGDDVIVAPLGRAPRGEPIPATGRVIARWLDGQPAAVEHASGDGCLRIVRVGLPSTGDLPLRSVFQRAVRGLLGPCASAVADAPVDSLALARFAGANGLATAANLRGDGAPPSPLVPWLLGVALASAVAELLLRSRRAGAHG